MKTASRWLSIILLLPAVPTGTVSTVAQSAKNGSRNLEAAKPAAPYRVLGSEACVKCHAAENQVWKKTPHTTTLDQLHRLPEAKAIASKLGLKSIKKSGRCVACHYTQNRRPIHRCM
jgi:hypothetical protein